MKAKFTLTLSFLLTLTTFAGYAQVILKGKITDETGMPVSGASVSLENTLDGTSSDSTGSFSLSTTEQGQQNLVISYVGYETINKSIKVEESTGIPLNFKFTNVTNTLQQVSITAGSFGSADGSQKTVLEPLDIVTTAGSGADPNAPMQMLPGVQPNGTQDR